MRGRKIVRKYLVRSPYKPVVKTTRFKQPSYTIRTLFRTPTLRDATVQEMLSTVKHECDLLCKLVPSSSILRSSSVHSLKEVKWESVQDDLKSRAPVLLSVLTTAATGGSGSSTRSPPPSVIGMAAAVLLKARSKNMCKLQAMVGALLYAGHASKRVSACAYTNYSLSQLGLHALMWFNDCSFIHIGLYQIEQAWC